MSGKKGMGPIGWLFVLGVAAVLIYGAVHGFGDSLNAR